MAAIQRDAVQLALDLLVTDPDLRGFFRAFIKRLVDDSAAHACGVWLLDEGGSTTDLWMANIGGETLTADSGGWASLDPPRESMSRHLIACEERHTEIVEYDGDDQRLPEAVREFNRTAGVKSLVVAPLYLSPKTLGWIALSSVEDSELRAALVGVALIDATAKQATSRSTTAVWSIAVCWKRVVRRCSKSAIALPATSTTRWRRGSARSSCSCRPRSGPAVRICRRR